MKSRVYRVLLLATLVLSVWLLTRSVGVPVTHSPGVNPSRAPSNSTTVDKLQPPVATKIAKPAASIDPMAAFVRWTSRWTASAPSARGALFAEGLALAQTRREALARLIRWDPAAALAQAVPMTVRAQLPAEILAFLEERVSGRGSLSLVQACFRPADTNHDHHDEDLYRSAYVNKREYRAYTYGSRLTDGSLNQTSIIGVAIDRQLAVSDARYRVLESGETPSVRPVAASATVANPDPATALNLAAGVVAVEADGVIHFLSSAEALPEFAAGLVASEPRLAAPAIGYDGSPGSSTVTGRPSSASTHGTHKVLVIRVDFSDLPGAPISEDTAVNVINNPGGVADFYTQSSYGQSTVSVAPAINGNSSDVTEVFRLPTTAASYAAGALNDTLHNDAEDLATKAGYVLGNYQHLVVVFAGLEGLPNSQITYGGLATIIGNRVWINGEYDFRVVAHELGHNYGLNHSCLWQVNDGNPVSAAGASSDYNDPFDTMGANWGNATNLDFSQWNKSILQWLPDSAVSVAAATGTYRVYRLDHGSANLSLPRALKIPRDDTCDYWIGYRRSIDNAALNSGAYVLWGYNQNARGNLIDFNTPGANTGDSPLAVGQTFNDSVCGITLSTVGQGGTGADAWLDLSVVILPRVRWSQPTYYVNENGGLATLTLKRFACAAGVVSIHYSTAPGTALSPDNFFAQSGSVTWADGDVADKTITIPVVVDTVTDGMKSFTVTLSSITGGVISNPTTTVNVYDLGVRDDSFNWNNMTSTTNVSRLLVQPDGNVLIAGTFQWLQDWGYTTRYHGGVSRIAPSGQPDPTFTPGTGASNSVNALARQPDGKILIGGNFSSYNGTARKYLARLNVDGSLDPSFDPGVGPYLGVNDILVQPDGKILVGGIFTKFNGSTSKGLVRLNADGSLDTSFSTSSFNGYLGVYKLALQPDGKILAAGSISFNGSVVGVYKSGLARFNADGTRDASFDVGLGATTSSTDKPDYVYQCSLQPDGKIMIGGTFVKFGGKSHNRIARINPDGSVDTSTSLNPSADNKVSALLLQPDGKILIGGDFTQVNSVAVSHIARLNPDCSLDTAFSLPGGTDQPLTDFALQPDGNILFSCSTAANYQAGSHAESIWRLFAGFPILPGTLQVSTPAVSVNKGTAVNLTVTRNGGSLGALQVGYATVPGSATTADYTPTSGFLSWADGDATPKTITVPTSASGPAASGATFTVNLAAPINASVILGAQQQTVVTLQACFASWQALKFSVAERANQAISGPTADPDGDGVNNLLEYAFGFEPKTANSAAQPVVGTVTIGGLDYLTLAYRRLVPASPDLTYTPQATGDLAGVWDATPVPLSGPVANGDGTETVTYRDATPFTGATKRFLRLKVTQQP